jgi:hypothetical protein
MLKLISGRRVVLAWLLSVGAAIAGTAAIMSAQPAPPGVRVLTGNDIGFRVEGNRGDYPVGTLVVRINGKWVDAAFATKAIPAR